MEVNQDITASPNDMSTGSTEQLDHSQRASSDDSVYYLDPRWARAELDRLQQARKDAQDEEARFQAIYNASLDSLTANLERSIFDIEAWWTRMIRDRNPEFPSVLTNRVRWEDPSDPYNYRGLNLYRYTGPLPRPVVSRPSGSAGDADDDLDDGYRTPLDWKKSNICVSVHIFRHSGAITPHTIKLWEDEVESSLEEELQGRDQRRIFVVLSYSSRACFRILDTRSRGRRRWIVDQVVDQTDEEANDGKGWLRPGTDISLDDEFGYLYARNFLQRGIENAAP